MHVIDWLLNQNPVVKRLTKKYLLNQVVDDHEAGWIYDYLALYDMDEHLFGHGVYGPKFISTHYTMLELMDMEIDPSHPIYQDALRTLLSHEWSDHGYYRKHIHVDMCVAAMLLKMSAYGLSKDSKIYEMIDYILAYQMVDGGWNCCHERKPKPHISSVHTTLSVIEAFHQVLKHNYTYRNDEIKIALSNGIAVLLSRELYKNKKTGQPIHPAMMKATYPPRWKYDIMRALEVLASMNYPYDPRMADALTHLKTQMRGPLMRKGSKIPGRIHFPLEQGPYGAMNTLRMLKILKAYDRETYHQMIQKDMNL